MQSAIANFRLPRWEGQQRYVELWVEKQAAAGMVAPIADEFHVTLAINKGYTSSSAMHESAMRIRESADGRPTVILYLGDHDPSGEDAVRDIRDRLEEFGAGDVDVRKVALTMAQIKLYRPPPDPAKVTDSRAAAYIRRHGNRSWEIEALRPAVREKMIRKALEVLVDRDLMDAVIEREETGKAQLERALRRIK